MPQLSSRKNGLRALGASWCLLGSVLAGSAWGQEGTFSPPDFDLAVIASPEHVFSTTPGETVEIQATVKLRSTRTDPVDLVGAQAWTLSMALSPEASVREATLENTAGDTVPAGFYIDGEGFRLTTVVGDSADGVVSAVALSFFTPTWIPASGEVTLLKLVVETQVPPTGQGCRPIRIEFRDGLRGAGQPIDNTITYRGQTRRDDGSERDSDSDRADDATVYVCSPAVFSRGDCSPNDEVDLSDAIFALGYLFLGREEPPCIAACDTNDDELLDITDAIYLLNFLFLGGPEVPPPFRTCGEDPTQGRLSCNDSGC